MHMDAKDYILGERDFFTDMPYTDFRLREKKEYTTSESKAENEFKCKIYRNEMMIKMGFDPKKPEDQKKFIKKIKEIDLELKTLMENILSGKKIGE